MGRIHLVMGVAVALAVGAPSRAQSTSSFTPAQRAEGEAQIRTAAAYLAKVSREPSSTSFRNVFIQKRITKDGREPVTLCGEVNGRNGYGGFTGFQPFVLLGDTVSVGKVAGLDVGQLCKGRDPIVDDRDYSPEMRKAYAEALGS